MTVQTEKILGIFDNYRMPPTINDQYDLVGKQILADKIDSFITKNKTIDFVMLGFPFKSTNTRDKVLGPKPDLGERLTLSNFSDFNSEVKEIYSPGVNFSIASDGLVFSDLYRQFNLIVSDKQVHEYVDISKGMGQDLDAPMTWFDLNDFYPSDVFTNRDKLMSHFGITDLQLENLIMTNENVNYLYRGMIQFMSGEMATHTFNSGKEKDRIIKRLVRQMMHRNEAWSNLVKKEFHNHIRISMHPSINNGEKFSFQLIQGSNIRHSCWHCVMVFDTKSETYSTMHKKDAEIAGYELVYEAKQPFYYQN